MVGKRRKPQRAGGSGCGIGAYDVVADTHVGLIRDCNEDSFGYWAEGGRPSALVVVTDGIGGHDCGDIASVLCTRRLLATWRNRRMFEVAARPALTEFLTETIGGANDTIYRLNREFGIQHPMGTTIVAGIFTAAHLLMAHAGDSRCYRLRNGVITRLTQDHSFVAELIHKKIISPVEARNHPFAHIISKSVGPIPHLEVEINVFERQPRDRYVFCSDGLCAHVEDPEIETILYDATNPFEAVKNLLYASLRGGGEDNVTVLCVFT